MALPAAENDEYFFTLQAGAELSSAQVIRARSKTNASAAVFIGG